MGLVDSDAVDLVHHPVNHLRGSAPSANSRIIRPGCRAVAGNAIDGIGGTRPTSGLHSVRRHRRAGECWRGGGCAVGEGAVHGPHGHGNAHRGHLRPRARSGRDARSLSQPAATRSPPRRLYAQTICSTVARWALRPRDDYVYDAGRRHHPSTGSIRRAGLQPGDQPGKLLEPAWPGLEAEHGLQIRADRHEWRSITTKGNVGSIGHGRRHVRMPKLLMHCAVTEGSGGSPATPAPSSTLSSSAPQDDETAKIATRS